MNNETVLKMINKRIDELSESYTVLNESHQTLELAFARMEAEWETTKSLIKFIFGTSLLGLVVSLLTILKIFGAI